MTLDHYLTPYVKNNSERIKDLNIRLETIKLQENLVGKFLDIRLGHNFFLHLIPKTEVKLNKWDYMKPKSFL